MIIKKNVPLAGLTTMRVGGPARFFSAVRTIDNLKEVILFAKQRNLPIFILGDGSNIIMNDKGFHGVVVRLLLKGVMFSDHTRDKVLVTAFAGENWDDLVLRTVEKKLYGLENYTLWKNISCIVYRASCILYPVS